jgi:hypothetical protein
MVMDIREHSVCQFCGGKPPHCCPSQREAATVRAAVEAAMPPVPEIPIEKVTLQEEVKLFRCTTVLAYTDSKVFGLRSTEFEIPNPVPVHDQNNRRVGFALVEIKQGFGGRYLQAEISMDYATEERLLVQNGERLWAYAFGTLRVNPKSLQVFDFQRPLTVEHLKIEGVQILARAPTDHRLDPIRELSV